MGGSFQRIRHNQNGSNAVPTIDLGVDTNGFDPANAMFNSTNFPGASNANLNDARALYALLTGRVTAINATGRLDAAAPHPADHAFAGIQVRSSLGQDQALTLLADPSAYGGH